MRQWLSLVGQRFGDLVVIAQAETSPTGQRKWLCQCDCGKQSVVFGTNLRRGTTTSCGCRRCRDLAGKKIGRLMVLERSEKYGPRGKRRARLWKCRCDCGAITYKATDTLTNGDLSMCQECAARHAIVKAREKAGFVAGTQIAKIRSQSETSENLSGVRGVYLDQRTGKYRARLKFQGKLYNLGVYDDLGEAVKARRRGEEEIFGKFLENHEKKEDQK